MRHAILDYLNHITWEQSDGTPAQLRDRIDRAAGRLHEAVLIVQAAYDEIADEMSRQSSNPTVAPRRPRTKRDANDDIPL